MNTKLYSNYKNEELLVDFLKLPENDQIGWILGILETDGSIGFTYQNDSGKKSNNPRNYRVNFFLEFSQKDEKVRTIVSYFFNEKVKLTSQSSNVSNTKENSKSRAPSIKWSGTSNMKRFLEFLDNAQKNNLFFLRSKKFDELLIREILTLMPTGRNIQPNERSEENAQKILDMKYAFRQPNPNDRKDDLSFASGRKSRKQWEQDLNLNNNSSKNASTLNLNNVDTKFANFINNSNNFKIVNNYFITGLLEGDGSITFTINNESLTKNKKTKGLKDLSIEINFQFVVAKNSEFLANYVAKFFNIKKINFIESSNESRTFKTILSNSNINVRKNILNFLEKYPFFNDSKKSRYLLLKKLDNCGFFENPGKLEKNILKAIIENIYDLQGKGRQRSISREEMLKRSDTI